MAPTDLVTPRATRPLARRAGSCLFCHCDAAASLPSGPVKSASHLLVVLQVGRGCLTSPGGSGCRLAVVVPIEAKSYENRHELIPAISLDLGARVEVNRACAFGGRGEAVAVDNLPGLIRSVE